MSHQFTDLSPIQRRGFLKAVAALAAGALAPSCARRSDGGEKPVLIVGAGMAGLTAASELRKQGIPTLVIEGRDRIGGRIHTWRGLSAPVDLGASWIHGAEGNPVTELARGFGVQTVATDLFSNSLHDSDGRKLTMKEIMEFTTAGNRLNDTLKQTAASSSDDLALDAAIEKILSDGSFNADNRRRLKLAAAGLEQEYAADLSDVSMRWHASAEGFAGKDRLFPEGYKQLIDGLGAGLDIRTGQIVRRIEHGGRAARVITDKTEFEGRAVIVTVPLGVLRAGKIEFHPALPDRKRQAISRLHMDVLNKVVLEFPSAFWPDNIDFIFHVPGSPDAFPDFVNYARLTGKPILVALQGGKFARQMETMSDDEILRAAMKTLRTIYGPNIPDPVAHAITRWGSDPFSLGSYSHIPPGASADDYDALAEPAGERLFFAGEATERRYHSTVHGAHISGLREARRFGGK